MAHYFRVDHELKLLAAFSPKCASCSIQKWMDALAHASGQGEIRSFQDRSFIRFHEFSKYPDYISVLFLRDPLRRLVGFYLRWVVSSPGRWDFADEERRFSLQGKSFRQFLFVLDHLHRHNLCLQHHLEAQVKNLQDKVFDEVVLTENLDTGLRSLGARLGHEIKDWHEHRTPRNRRLRNFVGDRSPAELSRDGIPGDAWFYDDEARKLAFRIYAEDIALYQAHGGSVLEPAMKLQSQ